MDTGLCAARSGGRSACGCRGDGFASIQVAVEAGEVRAGNLEAKAMTAPEDVAGGS